MFSLRITAKKLRNIASSDANSLSNLRPKRDSDRKVLHLLLVINLLLTVIPSTNLVLSNPWSVRLARQEHAQWKLRSARITNEPLDLIFRKKKKNGLGMENKTQESISLVTQPWLTLLVTRSSAMPVCSGFMPKLQMWVGKRALLGKRNYFFMMFCISSICYVIPPKEIQNK